MKIDSLSIVGSKLYTFDVFEDSRGSFREWFKSSTMRNSMEALEIKQANFSISKINTIRGMHYSLSPEGQEKFVTCVGGSMIDVLVDFRIGSPSFLKTQYIELNVNSGKVVHVPSGVGHGFIAKSELSSIVYLLSSTYNPTLEKSVHPLDPQLEIDWPISDIQLAKISDRDLRAPYFNDAKKMNILPHFKF